MGERGKGNGERGMVKEMMKNIHLRTPYQVM